MCVVVQHPLGKGAAAHPRCIPQPWLLQGIEPIAEPAERIAVPSLAGDFALPAPIDQGAYRRPCNPTRRTWRYASPPAPHHAQPAARLTGNQGSVPAAPDTPMTISWRPGREPRAALALDPSHRPGSLRAPWTPDQPCADWMPSGAFAPLNPRAKGVPALVQS